MIDVKNESLIPIKQLRDRLPSSRTGKTVGTASIYRWINRGLETVKIGGVLYTTWEAVGRFAKHGQASKTTGRNESMMRRLPIVPAQLARDRLRMMVSGII